MLWFFKDPRLRRDRWLLVMNSAITLFNLGWALAFPENAFVWLNWLAAGFGIATTVNQPVVAKWRLLVEDQTATILASNAALDAMSPASLRTMVEGALADVVAQMRRDGSLPPDVDVQLGDDDKPKVVH